MPKVSPHGAGSVCGRRAPRRAAVRLRPRRVGAVAVLGLLPWSLVLISLAASLPAAGILAAYFVARLCLKPFIVY